MGLLNELVEEPKPKGGLLADLLEPTEPVDLQQLYKRAEIVYDVSDANNIPLETVMDNYGLIVQDERTGTLTDLGRALKETPENLRIGTIGMGAGLLFALKRRGMQLSGAGIFPDEMVKRQFEPVTPKVQQELPNIPGIIKPTLQDWPPLGAITSEAFALTSRLPHVGGYVLREEQRKRIEAQDRVTIKNAPITRLLRSVTQSGVPSMGAAIGVGLLTGDPILALGFLGEMEGGSEFQEQLESGATIFKANVIADLSEAAEIGGEMLVLPKILKGVRTGATLRQWIHTILENATQEGVTGFHQEFFSVFGTETSKGTSIEEAAIKALNAGIKAIPENAWVGGATAGVVGTIRGGFDVVTRPPEAKPLLSEMEMPPVRPGQITTIEEEARKPVEPTPTTPEAEIVAPEPAKPPSEAVGEKPRMVQAGGIATEKVTPNLYIGNVTPGMKRRIAESGEFAPEDIQGFKEAGFPTKRTKIELTRAEASNALTWGIRAIDEIVSQVEKGPISMTYNEVAMTQALIGDIKALQEALGYEVKPADLTIRLAKKLRAKLAGEVLQRMPADLAASVSEAMDLTVKQAVQQFVKPTEEVTKTTYEIFRDAMKHVSEASEKAYLAGARDTVKQHKNLAKIAKERLEKAEVTQGEMNRLLGAVSRARTEKEQVHAMAAVQAIADKARKRHAAKRIKKPTPMSVDFFYREAIENIKAGIDPSFRTEKTLTRRRRTEEFFQKHPEKVKDIPAKTRRMLTKKSLGEMTIEELEQAAQAIETLEQQGKLKRTLTLAQRERRFGETEDQLLEVITKGEAIEEETRPQVFSTTKEGLVKTAAIKTRAWTLRPARIFDLLDGRKNFTGPNHEFFINKVNELTDKKWRMTDARLNPGKAKQEELGIDAKSLSQTRVVNNIRYTVDEMIDIYAKSKNVASKLAMMYGNNLEEADIEAVTNALSDKEKEWGDYIISDYGDNYERLRNTVIEVENRDMGFEENYTPIRRTDIDYKTHTQEIVDSLLQRETLRNAYTAKGFTIQRKNIPAEFQRPIRLGITSMWLEQVAKQEHYMNLARHVRDMHRMRERIRNAVRKQFGNEYNKVIKGYVNRVANPNIYRSFDSLENVSRRLRQNAAVAYLSYNLLTMGKQLPSAFLYLPDAGLTHWIASAARFGLHPLATIQRVRELDPQVKHKAIERELEELKKAGGNIVTRVIKRFGRLGMQGIYMMDAVARTIGWDAVYQKALDDHLSEPEAIRAAQNATLRTQPAAAAKDLPQLYATSEFAHWFTMFTNQLNQIYNIASYDIPSYVINTQYGNAALGALGLGVTALAIWMISHRDVPDEPEDFLEAATEQAINATPLVGKAIMAGKKGWGDSGIPAFEGGKAFGRALAAIERGEFTDNDVKIVTEAIAVTFGVPYIGPKRIITAVERQQPSALLGGRQKKKSRSMPDFGD